MKNIKPSLLSFFLMISLFGKSQTIDYAYEQLSTSSCNIFASTTVVDNYNHLTALSRPKYSDNSILLDCKANNSTSVLSTIYSINYSFKVGYNYKISVYYKGVKDAADPFYPNVGFKISITNGGTDAGSNCVSPSSYSLSNANSFTQGSSGSSYAWANNLVNVTITQAANYLLVGAFPYPNTSYLASVYIRKIQIVETPPPMPFTLPSTTNVPCGSASPVTFTVTNVNNTPNVTNYTWNLGATPNGWLYNGSAAPQTVSTGTTNTISLSPGGGTLSNINATVTAGGNTYNTNTSNINITPPSLSITGNSAFCTSETYSVANLPSGASVSWSASPLTIVYFTNANGSQITANKSNAGIFSLTAIVTSSCGTDTITRNYLTAGIPAGGDIWTSGDQSIILQSWAEGRNYIYENTEVHFHIGGATSASQYAYSAGNLSNTPFFDGWDFVFYMYPNNWATFAVNVTSGGCNETLHYDFQSIGWPRSVPKHVNSEIKNDEKLKYHYRIAPDPVSSELNIYVDDQNLKNSMQRVVIVDMSGKILMRQNYSPNTNKVSLNVSNLPSTVYVARIYDGKKWTSIKFLKK